MFFVYPKTPCFGVIGLQFRLFVFFRGGGEGCLCGVPSWFTLSVVFNCLRLLKVVLSWQILISVTATEF